MAAAELPLCPCCGGSRWGAPWPGTLLRPCARCGVLFHDRSPDRQREEALYDRCAGVPVRDREAVARSQWRWTETRCLGDRGAAGARVLDVGCGSGEFLEQARDAGALAVGLELDPAAVERCRERCLDVRQGSLFDTGLPDGPWDVIAFWDVLDHLDDPREALRLAAAGLAPGGRLVARGRNAAVHGRLVRLRGRWGPLDRLGRAAVVHRWGFSPRSWTRLLQQAGLADVTLHPGLPTPGDRYGTLGGASAVRFAKAASGALGAALHALTARRLYPFSSVLITGRATREA